MFPALLLLATASLVNDVRTLIAKNDIAGAERAAFPNLIWTEPAAANDNAGGPVRSRQRLLEGRAASFGGFSRCPPF